MCSVYLECHHVNVVPLPLKAALSTSAIGLNLGLYMTVILPHVDDLRFSLAG